jgi:hypothetical protein
VSNDRDRQRARRARLAAGQIPVVVCIDEVAWQVALTEAGFLTHADPDKKALGDALSVMLDRLLHADLATLSRRDNP